MCGTNILFTSNVFSPTLKYNNKNNDMNNKNTLSFLGSLSSKICHDIVAPVSAIDMGLSLLDEHLPDSIKFDPAYGLLKDSLNKTLNRINFFRYAFAFGKSDSVPTLKEFTEHCQNACAHYKIKFYLDEFDPPSDQPSLLLRMTTCILYLLTDTVPKGGSITMSITPKLTSFDAAGSMVIMNPSLEKILQNVRESYRAQTILPELILMGLEELKLQVDIKKTQTSLTVILR